MEVVNESAETRVLDARQHRGGVHWMPVGRHRVEDEVTEARLHPGPEEALELLVARALFCRWREERTRLGVE